ncbi:MAG: hypothetical protein EBZ53_07020 [Verrucomicrobia bacterium]|nr:hypothetical protein [Verrucomicrobiota bacterium]
MHFLVDSSYVIRSGHFDISGGHFWLLFDFHNLNLPSQGLVWEQLPEKWEGLALLSDNRLLVICDNDFLTPELTIGGKKAPFPKCQIPVNTWWFLIKLR